MEQGFEPGRIELLFSKHFLEKTHVGVQSRVLVLVAFGVLLLWGFELLSSGGSVLLGRARYFDADALAALVLLRLLLFSPAFLNLEVVVNLGVDLEVSGLRRVNTHLRGLLRQVFD